MSSTAWLIFFLGSGHADVVVPGLGASPAQGLAAADRLASAVLRPAQVPGQAVEEVPEGPHRHRFEECQRQVKGDQPPHSFVSIDL